MGVAQSHAKINLFVPDYPSLHYNLRDQLEEFRFVRNALIHEFNIPPVDDEVYSIIQRFLHGKEGFDFIHQEYISERDGWIKKCAV